MEDMKVVEMPFPSGGVVKHPSEKEEKMTAERQTAFWLGVGSLLYLVKHSRPNLANATRELAKVMDGGMEQHYKQLLWVMRYVLRTKWKGVALKPKKLEEDLKWKVEAFGDSNHAGDTDAHSRMTGWIIYLMDAPVS